MVLGTDVLTPLGEELRAAGPRAPASASCGCSAARAEVRGRALAWGARRQAGHVRAEARPRPAWELAKV